MKECLFVCEVPRASPFLPLPQYFFPFLPFVPAFLFAHSVRSISSDTSFPSIHFLVTILFRSFRFDGSFSPFRLLRSRRSFCIVQYASLLPYGLPFTKGSPSVHPVSFRPCKLLLLENRGQGLFSRWTFVFLGPSCNPDRDSDPLCSTNTNNLTDMCS